MSLDETIQEIFDQFKDEVRLGYGSIERKEGQEEPERVCSVIQWSLKGHGFGEFTIIQTPEGVFLDTESTNKKGVKKILGMLVDAAITDMDEEPWKHTRYNEVMKRECSESCRICYPKPA